MNRADRRKAAATETKTQKVGRLAMRAEGEQWNAYYALPDTMEGAHYLGSIRLAFVANPKRKDAFMALMRECIADMLEETTGVRPTWPDGAQPAPEHERTRE